MNLKWIRKCPFLSHFRLFIWMQRRQLLLRQIREQRNHRHKFHFRETIWKCVSFILVQINFECVCSAVLFSCFSRSSSFHHTIEMTFYSRLHVLVACLVKSKHKNNITIIWFEKWTQKKIWWVSLFLASLPLFRFCSFRCAELLVFLATRKMSRAANGNAKIIHVVASLLR